MKRIEIERKAACGGKTPQVFTKLFGSVKRFPFVFNLLWLFDPSFVALLFFSFEPNRPSCTSEDPLWIPPPAADTASSMPRRISFLFA